MACEAAVVKHQSLPFRRMPEPWLTLSSRRLEQKKQAGGGDFALIVVAVNLQLVQDNTLPKVNDRAG